MRHTRRMKIAAILGVRIGTAVAFGGSMRSRGVKGLTRALSITLALGACGGSTTGSPQTSNEPCSVTSACGTSTASSASRSSGTATGTSATVSAVDASTSMSSSDASSPIGAFDAAACTILASNYDQSCTVDTDCVRVAAGDYCGDECLCGGESTINVGALAQFNADVAKTPIGSGAVEGVGADCGCPTEIDNAPCCQGGQCVVGRCPETVDAAPANDDAPSGNELNYTVLCVADAGPLDAGYPGPPAIPGVSRWCNGPEVCTPFNGGWECCVFMAPQSMCVAP
jgi:hypothetical protein